MFHVAQKDLMLRCELCGKHFEPFVALKLLCVFSIVKLLRSLVVKNEFLYEINYFFYNGSAKASQFE